MLHPIFPHTPEWVKLMAEYLQSQIIASGWYQYAYSDIFIPVIFLAGAPWAGKTEWIESFPDIDHYVILDTDLYRSLFEGYTGTNAYDFHQYASRVMDRMYSFCIKNGYNMIVDGTFANLQKATENIRQCEKRWIEFSVILVLQNPIISYLYTKKREQEKKRNVPTSVFVEKYYRSIQITRSVLIQYPQAKIYVAEKIAEWKFSFMRTLWEEDFDNLTTLPYNPDELSLYIEELSRQIQQNPAIIHTHLWHLHNRGSRDSSKHDS